LDSRDLVAPQIGGYIKIDIQSFGHFSATQPTVGGSEEVINSLFVSALMALGQPTDISQTFGISPQSG
jgi:hypothetical protein